MHFDLESAPSGHLCLAVDNFGDLQPPAGGLQARELTLLATGGGPTPQGDYDGRDFGKFKIQLLDPNAKVPTKATPGSAGYDLHASKDISIKAQSRELVSTGIAALAPPGTYLRIAPRSGLALKGIDVVAGVVDPDYRGEIKVIMANFGPTAFVVSQGTRIAQMIFERVLSNLEAEVVSSLPTSSRGTGGFGHTDRVYYNYDDVDDNGPSSTAMAAELVALPPACTPSPQ